MSPIVKPERQAAELRALQAIARQCPAARPASAGFIIRGKPIALEVAHMPLMPSSARRAANKSARARLREDRVAQRVLLDLESKLNPQLNDGRTIILTLGAPIKVANKLVAALTGILHSYLAGGAEDIDVSKRVLGNRVRFRVMKAGSRWAPQLIGFVFTGDPSPGLLGSTLVALHEAIAKSPARRVAAKGAGKRWLALVGEDWIADCKTYQRAFTKISPPHGYDRILMVSESGRVDVLADANQADRH